MYKASLKKKKINFLSGIWAKKVLLFLRLILKKSDKTFLDKAPQSYPEMLSRADPSNISFRRKSEFFPVNSYYNGVITEGKQLPVPETQFYKAFDTRSLILKYVGNSLNLATTSSGSVVIKLITFLLRLLVLSIFSVLLIFFALSFFLGGWVLTNNFDFVNTIIVSSYILINDGSALFLKETAFLLMFFDFWHITNLVSASVLFTVLSFFDNLVPTEYYYFYSLFDFFLSEVVYSFFLRWEFWFTNSEHFFSLPDIDFITRFSSSVKFFVFFLLWLIIFVLILVLRTWLLAALKRTDLWRFLTNWAFSNDWDTRFLRIEPISQLIGRQDINSFFASERAKHLGSGYYNTLESLLSLPNQTFFGYSGFLNLFPSTETVFNLNFFIKRKLNSQTRLRWFSLDTNYYEELIVATVGSEVRRSVIQSPIFRNWAALSRYNFFSTNFILRPKFEKNSDYHGLVWLFSLFKQIWSPEDPNLVSLRTKFFRRTSLDAIPVLDNTSEDEADSELTENGKSSVLDLYSREINNFVNSRSLTLNFSQNKWKKFNFGAIEIFGDYSFWLKDRNYSAEFEHQDDGFFFEPEDDFLGSSSLPQYEATSENDDELFDEDDLDTSDEFFFEDGYLHKDLESVFFDDEFDEIFEEGFLDSEFFDAEGSSESDLANDDEAEEALGVVGTQFGHEMDYRERTFSSHYAGDAGLEGRSSIIYRERAFDNFYDDLSDFYWINSDLDFFKNLFMYPVNRTLAAWPQLKSHRRYGWIQRILRGRAEYFASLDINQLFLLREHTVFKVIALWRPIFFSFVVFFFLSALSFYVFIHGCVLFMNFFSLSYLFSFAVLCCLVMLILILFSLFYLTLMDGILFYSIINISTFLPLFGIFIVLNYLLSLDDFFFFKKKSKFLVMRYKLLGGGLKFIGSNHFLPAYLHKIIPDLKFSFNSGNYIGTVRPYLFTVYRGVLSRLLASSTMVSNSGNNLLFNERLNSTAFESVVHTSELQNKHVNDLTFELNGNLDTETVKRLKSQFFFFDFSMNLPGYDSTQVLSKTVGERAFWNHLVFFDKIETLSADKTVFARQITASSQLTNNNLLQLAWTSNTSELTSFFFSTLKWAKLQNLSRANLVPEFLFRQKQDLFRGSKDLQDYPDFLSFAALNRRESFKFLEPKSELTTQRLGLSSSNILRAFWAQNLLDRLSADFPVDTTRKNLATEGVFYSQFFRETNFPSLFDAGSPRLFWQRFYK